MSWPELKRRWFSICSPIDYSIVPRNAFVQNGCIKINLHGILPTRLQMSQKKLCVRMCSLFKRVTLNDYGADAGEYFPRSINLKTACFDFRNVSILKPFYLNLYVFSVIVILWSLYIIITASKLSSFGGTKVLMLSVPASPT